MKEYDRDRVRTVGLFSHGGAGKTMLVERILLDAGVTGRLGTITEGNTVSDYLDEEKSREHSICLSPIHLDYNGYRFNVIDCPGYADFVGEILGHRSATDHHLHLIANTLLFQGINDRLLLSHCRR